MADFFSESNKIIESLLQEIVNLVENEWSTISVLLTFPDRDSFNGTAMYTHDDKEYSFSFLNNQNISDKIWKLEKLYYSKEKGRLKKATFNIDRKGKFNLDVEYAQDM